MGEAEDVGSKFFSHVKALHERVHIASVSYILKTSISIADFSSLPNLLLIFAELSKSHSFKNVVQGMSLDCGIIPFFHFFQKLFGSLTQVRKPVLIQSIEFNNFFITCI